MTYLAFYFQTGLSIVFTVYAVAILMVYLILAIISLFELNQYLKNARITDFKNILTSPFAPGITLIAPAYNEGLSIIDNVKSLLSIMYSNLEVLIINDGSKDNTMVKLIEAFNLVKVPFHICHPIHTKPVKGVYKSKNRAFKNLIVVDKENGGKADALNVGINMSSKELVACIDVDCIIEREALLKMVHPFLNSAVPVIATGGVVRIANSCVIEDGRLVSVRLSEKLIVRFQTVEYIRAFLIGRMAWSKLNGLLLISGAFGLFRKDIAQHAGGYSTHTVGEDMELVMRMRSYMYKNKLPHKVVYIPEPLCWTEAPSDYTILSRQRNRWTRGAFETLRAHRKMFFNPAFGIVGMISYPFWFFFEWLAPLVEFSGLGFMFYQILVGNTNIFHCFALLFAIYTFSFFISMTALLAEEFSFNPYKRKRDILKLACTALLEPVIFHPRIVWSALKGNIDLLKGKKSWGEMRRKGFVQSPSNINLTTSA